MEGKKKRKNYFSNQGNNFKKRKRLSLECGMRGFLCTCNFREKECVREAYNLLEEYTDKIYVLNDKQSNITDEEVELNANGQSEKVKNKEENKPKSEDEELKKKESEDNKVEAELSEKDVSSDEDEEDEDISTALNKEINKLKTEAGKSSQKKFQVVDTGVTNVVFIKTTLPNPLELVTAVFKDLNETKKQKCRYLIRILPIQVVCKAYIDDIRIKADPLLEKYFAQESKTFAIVFNRHSNNNLHRNDVIEDLAKIISKKNPGNKANLKNPEIAVVVEVIRAVCLISIAPQYFAHKKYNLLEMCK